MHVPYLRPRVAVAHNAVSMIAYEIQPKPEFAAVPRVERPSPALGPHDVRIRVHAVSLNFRDLAIARGAHRRPKAPPLIAPSDGAGEIVEVGKSVSRFKGGERVAGAFFPTWIDGVPLP